MLFPETVEKKVSISETISGIGQLIGNSNFVSVSFIKGPVFGSFLYGLGGYSLPFIVFGGSGMFMCLVLNGTMG